jgi:hypothetical protein
MAFSITPAAVHEIRSRAESSGCKQPTASMMDSSASFQPSAEMLDAISRNAGEAEMLALAKKEHRELEATLEYHLSIGMYEAADCRPQDLILIDDVQFALPIEMREYLSQHVLDREKGRFLLRKGHRVYLRLMDLGKEEGSAV